MSILNTIKAHKYAEVAGLKNRCAGVAFEAISKHLPPPLDFAGAVAARRSAGGVALIAEIKKMSPSKGVIRGDFDVAEIAKAYAEGGATCLSVLTDETFFGGQHDFVVTARTVSGLPVLRKDFLIDPIQVVEARAMQADAVLLILAMLEDDRARELKAAAESYGMQVLIEIHDEIELERAMAMNAHMIGINNRNLTSFDADLSVSERLSGRVSPDRIVISESGISGVADVKRLLACGIHAFLIGETLMKSVDIKKATREIAELSEVGGKLAPDAGFALD